MDFDLIVVGAGPADSTLAREMALQGARILRAYLSGQAPDLSSYNSGTN
jgi:pyruvate/2-oxoglutarate dehydrogenase complex dihydrolipoamide dehydrogenase (E3) component